MKPANRLTAMALLTAAALCAAPLKSEDVPRVYPSGFSIALKLGSELYESLPPRARDQILPTPVALEMSNTPMVAPIETRDDSQIMRQVSASVGFIDLLNHIAHAKAIDRIEPGYFERYVFSLGEAKTNSLIPEVPDIANPRYWTEDVMNDQLSYFNQMFGVTIAINLAHLYLGNYDRHAAQLPLGKLSLINTVLSGAEWEAAVRAGAENSFNCALCTEGEHALLEAFAKMPQRPMWTQFFVPAGVDLRKMNKELSRYERDFFHGGLK